jgi:hypothetical protein
MIPPTPPPRRSSPIIEKPASQDERAGYARFFIAADMTKA